MSYMALDGSIVDGMYDCNGIEIQVGDMLLDTRSLIRLEVYDIRASIFFNIEIVIMCNDMNGGAEALYRDDLPHIEVVIPDDPCRFLERVPV